MRRRFTFTGSSSLSTLKSQLKSPITRLPRKMSTAMRFRLCALLLFSIAALPIIQSREQLSTRECESLGFTGLALCSDCNSFAEYVKDQELVSDCLKCCTEDNDDETSKITYTGAILEVCMRKLVFYPDVVGFIEEEKDRFPSVKVQYAFNSPPKLIMLDEDGQQKDTIRIDNWKREHILQFLQGKLKSVSPN